jgi:oligopeptide transport system substrate-binding protein
VLARKTSGWRRNRVAMLWVVALALLLSGCAAPWPFPQPTPDPKLPDAQQVFRPLEIGPNAGDLATLDPALITFGVDYQVAQLLFPGLVTLDDQQRVVDWAAERHEVSSDALTWTFHLRKGMSWSDGTPITAETFAYAINRTLDPCTRSDVAFYLYLIHGAEAFNTSACPVGSITSTTTLIGTSLLVSDPLTLQIILEHPAGYFLGALSYPTSWAMPKQLIEQYGDRWTEHLADNGGFGGNLFALTNWQRQASSPDGLGHLTFERNARFWGKKPLLRRIEYTLYRDTGTAWNAYKQGTGDTGAPVLQATASAKTLSGSTYHEAPRLANSYVQPNWQKAPFDDVRMRQAFWLAIDRQALMKTVRSQLAQPTIHLLIEGLPEYNANLRDPAGRSGAQALTADLTTARALVAAYAAEKCGGSVKSCTPVVYAFSPVRPETTQRADALIAQWQAAFPGWPINTSVCDRGCSISRIVGAPLSNVGWIADYPDGQDFLSLLWRAGAPYSRTNVSLPAADALLDQADTLTDRMQRTRLYQQAEQLLVDQVAAIPLTQSTYAYVVRTRVGGWGISPTGVTPLPVWQATYLRQ